jgi:signal transduction histidine kinase/CheY-like chemotaxis protein
MRMTPLDFFNRSVSREEIARMSILFGAYVTTAILGGYLFHAPAVIFPAAAIALAGLVIGGISLWPAITLASLVSSYFNDAPLIMATMLAVGHTVQAVTGARLLQIFNFDPVFRRVKDMFAFMGTAAITSAIVPAAGFFGFLILGFVSGVPVDVPVSWFSWWIGLFVADLVIASTVIRWLAKRDFTRTTKEKVELVAAFALMLAFTYLLFWTDTSWMGSGVAILIYFIPFVWFVLRLGMRFTLLAFALTTVVGLAGLLYGWQPADQEIGRRLLAGEIFIAAIAAIFYLFVAVVEERKRSAKEVGAQLERVNSLLEETKRQDRAKSDFIAVFAHELRNPLSPIVSSTELLKFRWGAHPEIAPIIETIEDRTRAIVRLLDDLLDVSRISRQTFKLRLEPVDLRALVEKVVRAMRPLAEKCGLTLQVSLPHRAVTVNADAVRIEQMLGNLVMNAIKYTDSGGRIDVSLGGDGNAEVRVKDTGVGIPQHMLPRIFTPFAGLGVEQRQRSVKEGLGIGLWLTENLVKEHGGTIAVTSEGPGKGSEFTITLPTVRQPITTNFFETMQPVIQKNGLRILVVDDNEAAAKGLGTLLSHVGNTVELAFVGAETVAKATEFKPDVIVLDIGLPDMSGYEVAEQLRLAGFGGKIVALTGYGQDEDKKKAEAAGFDHHLTKPVGIADLQAVLMPQAA